ncbi:MAG: DNA alkylation repair protein [Deltaproteobacteria bacterium]|nr:DNA alkylation repair protein [Deltaproteobacteria bacterium]
MSKLRAPLDPVADLRRRLARAGPRTLGLAKIRVCVRRWWADHGLAAHPATVGRRIAIVLIEQRSIAHKLAGILVLEQLGDRLRATDVPVFSRLFGGGHLAAFELVDRFATRVLGVLLDREAGQVDAVRAIASWRSADIAWQRRAACVSFIRLAALGDSTVPGLTSIILGVCATVVWSPVRCDQTAVGWVLRELSCAEPFRMESYFLRHARFMSRECARLAVSKLPAMQRSLLLARHARATTLRR